MDQFANIWKEHLKISEVTKFGSDLLITTRDIQVAKSRNFKDVVWWGAILGPLSTKYLLNASTLQSYSFTHSRKITFKHGQLADFAEGPIESVDKIW